MANEADVLTLYGEAAKTTVGFFWKSGWAFVLGYWVSAMIQAFVPKGRLTPYLGSPAPSSIALSSLFGAISSSCSFAALATARSLLLKGAHFVSAVAFMFASTNLVIELGILILIFLGWQFLLAEVIGGIVLIALSSILIVLTYPKTWIQEAHEKVEEEAPSEDGGFDWRQRIRSREGWQLVGHHFAMEWQMVWQEILIGFTIAGFVAVFVPASVWKAVFLADMAKSSGLNIWIVLENALLAPFVAAMTFIGSMGNIPLATILNGSGVLFAGIMGFIYSDLIVPPLVAVNAKYYGWRVALYIAAVMYVSIVATAIILNFSFALLGVLPESARQVKEITQFQIDYTFWMNLAAIVGAGVLYYLHRSHVKAQEKSMDGMEDGKKIGFKQIAVYIAILALCGGLATFFLHQV